MDYSGTRVLVAIPDDYRKEVCDFVEQQGLSVIAASTLAEALNIAQSQRLRGIITVGEWAIVDNDNNLPGLVENGDGTTPAMMLISREGFDRFFNWYNAHYSPLEEYCHVPFDIEELRARMKRVGMLTLQDTEG